MWAEIDQMRATLHNLKAQPAQQRSRRWLKFTIRGLILLTLGVSLFLGGRASRQREIDGIRAERDEATNRLKEAHMQADVARMRAEEAMARAEKALIEATQAKVRAMKGD